MCVVCPCCEHRLSIVKAFQTVLLILQQTLEAEVDLIFFLIKDFAVIQGWFPVDILMPAASKKERS